MTSGKYIIDFQNAIAKISVEGAPTERNQIFFFLASDSSINSMKWTAGGSELSTHLRNPRLTAKGTQLTRQLSFNIELA